MKPPPFTYHAVASTSEAVAALAQYKDEARVLAGGQSLVPLMNFRLARPAHLVDINRIADLNYIRRLNGALTIGAGVRQSALEHSVEAARHAPLLVEAVRFVAHPPIRHRGTVVGSLAHADPAAQLPAAVLALGGEIVLVSSRGERTVPVADFFQGPFATAALADELLKEYRAPTWPTGTGYAFVELSRTYGGFPVAGAAALLHLDGGRVDRAAIGLCAVAGTPVRAQPAEERLQGEKPSAKLLESAAEKAAATLEPPSDVHGSAAYRRKVARVLIRRALELALSRAQGGRS